MAPTFGTGVVVEDDRPPGRASRCLSVVWGAGAVYDFADIARGCGFSLEFVSEVGYSIDDGSNGFTAWKHGMTYEHVAANSGLD